MSRDPLFNSFEIGDPVAVKFVQSFESDMSDTAYEATRVTRGDITDLNLVGVGVEDSQSNLFIPWSRVVTMSIHI